MGDAPSHLRVRRELLQILSKSGKNLPFLRLAFRLLNANRNPQRSLDTEEM